MTMGANHSIKEDYTILHYDLTEHSKIAKNIIDVVMMSGSTHCELCKRIPEIIAEQRSEIEKLFN